MKRPDASFQFLACIYIRKQAKILHTHIKGIRIGDDIESIHQARVASRRICTALNIFKKAFPAKKVRRWNKHIRRLIKGLGAARDKDVQIEFVEKIVEDRTPAKQADLPGLKRLLLRLRQKRDAIQSQIIKTVDQLDNTGILPEILEVTTKSKSRLQKAGTDLSNPSILKRGVLDIQKTCNILLKLQSCLEDAEAIPQHHRMRIVAKKLRYTMEIYKKVFDKRLDESIKIVRSVQTLLGDIHDCDVWCEFIQTFTQEERQRTVDYYGHSRSFGRLRPGFEYLSNERATHRKDTFNELIALWKDLQRSRFWEELNTTLEDPHAGSYSQATDDISIQSKRSSSLIDNSNTTVSLHSEEYSLVHMASPQDESSEIIDNGEEGTLLPVPAPDRQELETYVSPNKEAEIETDRTNQNAVVETVSTFETSHNEELSLSDNTATFHSSADRPAVSSTHSMKKTICECCGRNGFLQIELSIIDSGQHLCPGCLDELHEKIGRMAK
jgi:CHAD domain-containing protein